MNLSWIRTGYHQIEDDFGEFKTAILIVVFFIYMWEV